MVPARGDLRCSRIPSEGVRAGRGDHDSDGPLNWTTPGQEPAHREDPEGSQGSSGYGLGHPRHQPPRLPAGIAAVLSVLSSSAVVIDSDDRVLRASAAARRSAWSRAIG